LRRFVEAELELEPVAAELEPVVAEDVQVEVLGEDSKVLTRWGLRLELLKQLR